MSPQGEARRHGELGQKTKPYTPRHNGTAERYQRIMTEELLYASEYASVMPTLHRNESGARRP